MERLEIKNNILQTLENVGLFFSAEELEKAAIGDLFDSSLQYISFIAELEQIFDIEIPDEYLEPEKLSSIDSIIDIITQLQQKK